jgi:hypothetical protein
LNKAEPLVNPIGNKIIQAKSIDNSRFEFQRTFPSVNTFSIDIDPFSSSSSKSSSTLSLNKKNPFDDLNILTNSSKVVNNSKEVDPFDIFDSQLKEEILLADQNKKNKDPFSVFESIFKNNKDQALNQKMSTTTEQTERDINQQLNDELASDFANINNEITGDQMNKIKEEVEEEEEEDITTATGKFRSESVVSNEVKIKDPFIIQAEEQEPNQNTELDANNEDDDDNMDNVFSNYSNLTQNQVDDLPSLANEIRNIDFTNTIVNQQDYNDQLDLAIRKGDTNLRSVELITKNDLVNNDDSSDDDFNYDFKKNINQNNNNDNINIDENFEKNENNENDRDLQDSLNDSIEEKFNIKSIEENENINNNIGNNLNDQSSSLTPDDNNMVKFYSKT